ncbi:MAG: hypothetical protein ACRD0U_05525 [Acidimicrobiales bacterium]
MTAAAPPTRARWPAALTLVGAIVVLAAAFLPWVRSGESERNSFELLGVARRLGVLDSGWQRVAVVGWYFMPLAVTLVGLAMLLGRRRAVALIGAAIGLGGVALVAAVRSAPVHTGMGVPITMVAGVVTAGGGVLTFASRRRTS